MFEQFLFLIFSAFQFSVEWDVCYTTEVFVLLGQRELIEVIMLAQSTEIKGKHKK